MKKKKNEMKDFKIFKFKIYWVYAIIFLFFLGLQFTNIESAEPTDWQTFKKEMLQKQKVL